MENNKNVLDKIFEETGVNYDNIPNINWSKISTDYKLSENFIREFKDKVDWVYISKHQILSENFIKEFEDKVDWFWICFSQTLSEDFIREFQNKVDWIYISINQNLSENFINEFKSEVDWVGISINQNLSENFIKEFKSEVDWFDVSIYQKLSENFIREFQNEVYWDYISKYQKLSENFIREFQNEVSWCYICEHQKLSPEFIKEFNLLIDDDNWLYKDAEFKKKEVIEIGLYECYDDYFIAYKAIRSDRYSHCNFQYQYLKGGVYECHCDCTKDENSFGLSVWTKKDAKKFNNSGLIVKIKIKYEDIGRIVHDGGKIRCFKFEVLD